MPDAAAKPSALRLLILAPTSDPTSLPPFSNLLHAITGSKPSDEVTSFSGYTSHPPLSLRTKYYNADVSIWCDELPSTSVSSAGRDKSTLTDLANPDGSEVPSSTSESETLLAAPPTKGSAEDAGNTHSTLEEWQSQMLSPAACEVRAVIGGIILILPTSPPSSSHSDAFSQSHMSLVEAVHSLREAAEDESYGRDIASIVVLQSTSPSITPAKLSQITEQLEESCLSDKGILGWDFVAWNGEPSTAESADERNEYGEKTGIRRVVEVLEGVDWSATPNRGDDEDGFDFDELDIDVDVDDPEDGGFSPRNILRNAQLSGLDYELQREMMELKIALGDAQGAEAGTGEQARTDVRDEDVQVEQLQGLMERVVAIREAGSEMPRTEREKFAKREIGRIIREMG